MRLLCYGDSNTYGFDPRSRLGGRYPEDVRWTGLLKAAGWDVLNEGMNGRSIPRSSGELQAAIRLIRRSGAEALTVMLGTNDLLHGASAEICAGRMERFLSALLEDGPLPLLLVSPPPVRPGAWVDGPHVIRESQRLTDCCGMLACRFGTGFADAGRWNVSLAYDGVHFSEEGHRAFAAGIQRALSLIMNNGDFAT